MSELVRIPDLWRQLTNRLNLEQRLSQVQTVITKSIVPTVNVDRILETPSGQTKLSVATTTINHRYTVPLGQRWCLKYLNGFREFSGTIDISIQTQPWKNSVSMVNEAPATVQRLPGYDIKIDPLGSILFTFGTGTSGYINSNILYTVDKI